jgi:hypothetical protein
MNNFGKHFPTLANNPDSQGWMVSVLTLGAMFGKHSYLLINMCRGVAVPIYTPLFQTANVCRMKGIPSAVILAFAIEC